MEKVRAALLRMAKTAIGESVPADLTGRLAKEIISGYDLHSRTGFPDSIPISGQIAASAVVEDAVAGGRFLPLVERIAVLDRDGFMGRPYPIPVLRELFKAIQAEGYLWDANTSHFMENPSIRRTANWGRLLEREEYHFSLLRLDIVKNSRLVRRHGEEAAQDAYAEVRESFRRAVEDRHGRIWKWEGDGALAAFHYGQVTTAATLAGIAFMNELFLYNRAGSTLGEPISVRLAAHTGPLRYASLASDITKQETVRDLVDLESRSTPSNCFCVSRTHSQTLERVVFDLLREHRVDGRLVYLYSVELEQP